MRGNCKTLHVKFFRFGSVEPVGTSNLEAWLLIFDFLIKLQAVPYPHSGLGQVWFYYDRNGKKINRKSNSFDGSRLELSAGNFKVVGD